MSLGISFTGQPPRSWLPFRRLGRTTAQVIAQLAAEYGYTLHHRSEDAIAVELCPTGYLEFSLDGETIKGEAQTTPTGPGFHMAVVDFIDALGRGCGLRLEVEDETDFWAHRDFARLQAEHLTWLRAVVRLVTDQPETDFLLAWPAGSWSPADHKGVICPLGPLTWSELHAAAADEADLRRLAERFFLWFNAERDALFHRSSALYSLWNECCWVEPRNGDEERLLTRIREALATARRLDPALPLPVRAWAEVLCLSGGDEREATGPAMPEPTPLGFRRGEIRVPFPGGWQAFLPGHFWTEWEEEGGMVHWDLDRNFRLSAFGLPPDQTYEPPVPDDPSVLARDRFTVGEFQYDATVTFSDDQAVWMLQGYIVGPGALAFVTITWATPDWQDWALSTFRSVKPPEPERT